MSEDRSRFPVQQKDDDWMEEFPLLVDPDAPPSRSTLADGFPRQETESMTDQLRPSAISKPLRAGRLQSAVQISDPRTDPLATATRQMSTLSRPSYDIPPAQSLVATLQSTIKAQLPTRGVVVIPGSRKKRLSASEEKWSQTPLRRLVRHGVVLLVVVIVMIVFLSMAPLR
jgi:hypothetical protein